MSFLWRDHTFSVPRKVLKDQFDASVEPDEPQQIDMDQNQDELYDEDQFYRESEAIPPAPKLHRELATSDTSTIIDEPSTSANPPMRSRDSSQLEGNFVRMTICFSHFISLFLYSCGFLVSLFRFGSVLFDLIYVFFVFRVRAVVNFWT